MFDESRGHSLPKQLSLEAMTAIMSGTTKARFESDDGATRWEHGIDGNGAFVGMFHWLKRMDTTMPRSDMMSKAEEVVRR